MDFAATALEHGREQADALGLRVEWLEADLGTWSPPTQAFDLVVCIYVHVAGSIESFVQRMADGVAPGGTLFMLGKTTAKGQTQVTVAAAKALLTSDDWELTAEAAGEDAVVRARRRG